jgi:hypothetical protein
MNVKFRPIFWFVIVGSLSLAAISFWSCLSVKKKQATLFESLSPDSTGIDFRNDIKTSDSLNIFSFEYIYNGGGVGIGDFNGDGLPDIFFGGNKVPGKLYVNQGHFHFKDITSSSKINTAGNWSFGISVIDINQDGLPDIYICVGGPSKKDSAYHNLLYINQGKDKNGDPFFKEMAAEYGLRDAGQSIQAAFFDYDHDGDLDMYLVKGGGFERSPIVPNPILRDGTAKNTDKLYRSDWDSVKGHPVFTDVSKQAGIQEEGFGLGISLLDINDDGWLDVYVTNDYLTNDLLYINNHDGTFSERLKDYFKHTSHFAMGNDVGDINNDALPDIMAADMLPTGHYDRMLMFGPNQYDKFNYSVNNGYAYQYMRNTLQLNNGQGRFSEIGQLAGVYKTGWSWSVLFADLDNDQYQDLYITNGFGKDITDLDFVKFRSNYVVKPGVTSTDQVLLDSLEARKDTKISNFAFRNTRDLRFEDKTEAWGFKKPSFSNGAAYADLDNDGDLDLVVNNIDDPVFIYKNRTIETDSNSSARFLKIKLEGPKENQDAIGARIIIKYDGKTQMRLQSVVRGFESTVGDILHFGLGSYKNVDTIEVRWPDGRESIYKNVAANQQVILKYNDLSNNHFQNTLTTTPVAFFKTVSPSSLGIHYRQNESRFNDFLYEKLLPKKYSMNGPGIAVSDVNGDGLDDFFVGGAFNQSGEIYIQNKNGGFTGHILSQPDAVSVDMGCLFFDADGDKDLDLYVVSGSSDYTKGHKYYQDRLYLNDGHGNFSRSTNALPSMINSGSCVAAADFDGDGDPDLFVGGRIVPGFFPEKPVSTILRNDKGKFTDVTESVAPGLRNIGMVTSALWTDIDNDGRPDLILTGEWMPLTIFRNTGNGFKNITATDGLAQSSGWWQSIVAGDFDNDGDMDYVVGNWGLNSPYKASEQHPMMVCYKDFDNDGKLDPVLSYYEDGDDYPVHSWDNMVLQMPFVRKKMPYYHNYAATSMNRFFAMVDTAHMERCYCNHLQSAYLENLGNGKFRLHDLPIQAQISPLLGMIAEDLNHDGNPDLVTVGNFYGTEVAIGRYDASVGAVFLGDGKGNFVPQTPDRSGFVVDGDAKALGRLEGAGGQSLFLASQNGDSLKILKDQTGLRCTRLPTTADEVYAKIFLKDGRVRKTEFYFESGYLSQSSRTLVITPDIDKIELYKTSGRLSRTVKFR